MSNNLFIFLAGIAITTGLAYFWVSIRNKLYGNNLSFALFSIFSGIYYLLATSDTVGMKTKLFFAAGMFVFFPWYFAYESKHVVKKFLWTISIIGILFYITVLLNAIPGVAPIRHSLAYTAYVLIGFYCIKCCIRIIRNKDLIVWPFIFVAGYFSFFAVEEILFDLFGKALPWRGIVSFTYLDLFPVVIISLKLILMVYDQIRKTRLEEEILLYKNNIDGILNLTNRIVLTLDEKGNVLFANPQFLSYFKSTEKIIGSNFPEKFISESERKTFIENVIEKEEKADDILTSINTIRGECFVSWSFVKLSDVNASNSENHICLFGADITPQVQAEKKLRVANTDLEVLKNKLLSENIQLKRVANATYSEGVLLGESPLFNYVLSRIEDVASNDIAVLLEGETGVGKELFATALHKKSPRAMKPFVKVNCAAIPEQLLESELFGFEKGAFTSADRLKRGMFELANGGTLFLDEIGDLPISLQPKLLRALQEGEIQRLGSEKVQKIDVRIVAATNRSLEKEVEHGRFRSDLYYRINVFPITIPPLRQRKVDIPLLVKAYTNSFNEKYSKKITEIPGSLMDELVSYPWPGNVRQLRNVIERAVVTSSESVLKLTDPLPSQTNGVSAKTINDVNQLLTLEECERQHIIKVLENCGGRISGARGAAELLGLPSSTLRSKMSKLGIPK